MARAKQRSNRVGRLGLDGSINPVTRGAAREHAHGDVELNLLLRGRMRYVFAGQTVEFPVGRWLAYWAALPHCVVSVEGECEIAWITVPVSNFLTWDNGGFTQRLLRGEMLAESAARPGSDHQARAINASLHGDARHKRIAELEIEALARRIALDARPLSQPVGRAGKSARGATLDAVERIAAWLSQHYRNEVDVPECAAATGLNPRYAMTVFREATGTTVGQYLRRLRLAHAQRLLITGDDDVLSIALDAGFGSLARFYVEFKRAYATTPSAYRRAHRC
jgi:AraC-like DNA-binding protein